MFSHVVIFWTKPDQSGATEALLAGAEKFLKPCPGVLHYHCGRMASSHRDVVDQSYQVGLNLVFDNKAAQDSYQEHPLHVEFVEKVFKPNCERALVYDFEN
ncbi:MAG: Dabb family protein [Alphaproteobacteria bacterium]|nr:Dabb family protein [Alphaproteobacteria bacterium]